MYAMKALLVLIVSALLVKDIAMAKPVLTSVNQSGCHNSLVLLDCSSYNQNKSKHALRWRYKNPAKNTWESLGKIINGKLIPQWKGTQFQQRLTLHANGSLEIKSLKTHDETLYRCKVSGLGTRNTHIINLSVACYGQVTQVQKHVCKGDDITLDCDARHRTNPKHIHKTTWRQKTGQGSWRHVATSTGRVLPNYQLTQNGSLLVPGQSSVDRILFRCIVTKGKARLPPERHGIEIRYILCQKNKTKAPTVVPLSGRAAMTTILITGGGNPVQNAVCGGRLAAISGGLESPNFPSAYPANSDCKWTISVPQDYAAIDLTLEQMDLEHDDSCQHDSIAVYDNLGNQVGCRRCGFYNRARTFRVGGRVATVVFRTDSDVQKTGFKLTYKATQHVGK